ncbi:MAG: DUF421 domain-containing protein [Caulobacteraceae bacterium]
MYDISETFARAFIGFSVLLLMMRLLGRKQLGQSNYFTYITGIAMGNIAGDMVVHRDIRLVDAIAGLILWALLTFLVEYISIKSAKARVVLDGEPSIIIKNGQIMQNALKANRLNMDDVTMLLRNNNTFCIADVDYAILEPNGQLSVLKKHGKETITRSDMNIKLEKRMCLPAEIIVDGNLVKNALEDNGLEKNWLLTELDKAGIHSYNDVFFAELQSDKTLYISTKT